MTAKTQALGLALTAGVALTALSTPAQACTVYTSLPAWRHDRHLQRHHPLRPEHHPQLGDHLHQFRSDHPARFLQ